MLHKPVNLWLVIKLKKGNKMFTTYADSANYGINMIQSAKKTWVSSFVKDEAIAKSLNSFVDAQTDFAKQIVKTGADVATVISKEVGKWPSNSK
jgi:hypothetical protein